MTTRHRWRRRIRPLAGRLLVATPALADPNFERSVVYLIAHDRQGAVGVVLNRATDLEVGEALAGWEGFAATPSVVFEGGPVEPDNVICLGALRHHDEIPSSFAPVCGSIGTVDLNQDPGKAGNRLDLVRFFAGYAGWSAQQLAIEIAEGAWLILDALPEDLFAVHPDDLWQIVLRRQPGLLAAVAQFPPDPILN